MSALFQDLSSMAYFLIAWCLFILVGSITLTVVSILVRLLVRRETRSLLFQAIDETLADHRTGKLSKHISQLSQNLLAEQSERKAIAIELSELHKKYLLLQREYEESKSQQEIRRLVAKHEQEKQEWNLEENRLNMALQKAHAERGEIADAEVRGHWTTFTQQLLEIYLTHVEWAPSLADRYRPSVVPKQLFELQEELIFKTNTLDDKAVSRSHRWLALARVRAMRHLLRDTYTWLAPIIDDHLKPEQVDAWIAAELRLSRLPVERILDKARQYLDHMYALADSEEGFRVAERFGVDRATETYRLRRKEQDVGERRIFNRFVAQERFDELIDWLQAMPEGSLLKQHGYHTLREIYLDSQPPPMPAPSAPPPEPKRPKKSPFIQPREDAIRNLQLLGGSPDEGELIETYDHLEHQEQ